MHGCVVVSVFFFPLVLLQFDADKYSRHVQTRLEVIPAVHLPNSFL